MEVIIVGRERVITTEHPTDGIKNWLTNPQDD
jgi:hypothetical protein